MENKDEFAGQGGSYTLDPKTGKRTLVQRTEQPQPQAPAASVEADDTLPPSDSKRRR